MTNVVAVEDIEWCAAHCGVIEVGREHCDVYTPGWSHGDDPCKGVTLYIKQGETK